MFYVIEGFRWCLLGVGQGPEPYMLWGVGLTVLIAITGMFMFRRTERSVVDLL